MHWHQGLLTYQAIFWRGRLDHSLTRLTDASPTNKQRRRYRRSLNYNVHHTPGFKSAVSETAGFTHHSTVFVADVSKMAGITHNSPEYVTAGSRMDDFVY